MLPWFSFAQESTVHAGRVTANKFSVIQAHLEITINYFFLGVFSESTARGLRFYASQISEFCNTASFVEFIGNLWKVMSLKTPSKGDNDLYAIICTLGQRFFIFEIFHSCYFNFLEPYF